MWVGLYFLEKSTLGTWPRGQGSPLGHLVLFRSSGERNNILGELLWLMLSSGKPKTSPSGKQEAQRAGIWITHAGPSVESASYFMVICITSWWKVEGNHLLDEGSVCCWHALC